MTFLKIYLIGVAVAFLIASWISLLNCSSFSLISCFILFIYCFLDYFSYIEILLF